MFKKWGHEEPETRHQGIRTDDTRGESPKDSAFKASDTSSSNTILKGSKLKGDINITCDLELSGEIEGNITSEQKSNIVIKGICRGNINTKEGNVNIDGQLLGGNITAGSNVNVSGKFAGGEIKAKGKIYVNGEFSGKLEGSEIEIGSNAKGKGEILYREYISIARGAKLEAQISQLQQELKLIKTAPEGDIKEKIKPVAKEAGADN